MRKTLLCLSLFLLFSSPSIAEAKQYVIEESYWYVPVENRTKFLNMYAKYTAPFWEEIRKKGWVADGIRIYSHRIHTKGHNWTYKTVVKFTDYASIDKWLENRDSIARKLFPEFANYSQMRAGFKQLTNYDLHWDEFLRELDPQ